MGEPRSEFPAAGAASVPLRDTPVTPSRSGAFVCSGSVRPSCLHRGFLCLGDGFVCPDDVFLCPGEVLLCPGDAFCVLTMVFGAPW